MSTRTIRRAHPKSPAVMKHEDHQRLWRMVEGAVASAFEAHPEYLTDAGAASAVQSITKRVVGNLVGHAHELRKQEPLGVRPS
jgi:hypothetical protein